MKKSTWVTALLIAAVTAVGAFGVTHGNAAPALSSSLTGDSDLAAEAAPYLSGVRDRVSICVWEDGRFTSAGFGADANTRYEIGSITKTFTGMLLADAVARDEVDIDDPVGRYLPLDDAPVASVTLRELAAHTSGLGEWGDDERDDTWMRWWVEDIRGDTIHNLDLEALYDRARTDSLSTRGEYRYSNIGFALLGHALAEAAGISYDTLLQERVLGPGGMSDSGLTSDTDRNAQRGYRADGRAAPPWRLGAYAPSGGVYSTVTDLCQYAVRLIDTHESDAAETDVDVLGTVMAGTDLGWDVSEEGDSFVLSKTGQTGGFQSVVALAPSASRVVVALTSTANDLDPLVQALLEGGR